MKDRIAIIEDIAEMAELIRLYLENEGWETVVFPTAEAALEGLADEKIDLVILDVNLPGMDGFAFLDRFRKERTTPVLIVSARSADEDIITGLGYGADEFVTKPFSPRVLVARVRAMFRRAQGLADPSDDLIRFGPFAFAAEACLLKKGTERISLSNKEFGVLQFLISQGGKPASPETIYRSVWKNEFGDLTAVAVYIQRLRRKLETNPSQPVYIETVPGMGYRINL
jgi:two-component system response regulator RegX3